MRSAVALASVLAINVGAFVAPLVAGIGAVAFLALLGPSVVRGLSE